MMRRISILGYLIFGFFILYYNSTRVSNWKFLQHQINELRLLRAIDVSYTNRDVEVLLEDDEYAPGWQSEEGEACFALKLSRASYASSPEKAEEFLNRDTNCSRSELVFLWTAELAWKKGNISEAQRIWFELPEMGY